MNPPAPALLLQRKFAHCGSTIPRWKELNRHGPRCDGAKHGCCFCAVTFLTAQRSDYAIGALRAIISPWSTVKARGVWRGPRSRKQIVPFPASRSLPALRRKEAVERRKPRKRSSIPSIRRARLESAVPTLSYLKMHLIRSAGWSFPEPYTARLLGPFARYQHRRLHPLHLDLAGD
jgi:hypothetical protein